jgi:hypothetical protein
MQMASTATHRPGPFASGPVTQPGPVESGERDARFDNEPPLEERIVMEFMEDLQKPGEQGGPSIAGRIEQLLASAARVPETCDETIAGGIGDLCKQAREVAQRLETARDKHNRPLLNAQRSLKGRADGLIAPLNDAIAKVRRQLDDFTRREAARREEERRREEEARRIAEEERRKLEEATRNRLEEQGLGDVVPADEPIFAPAPPPPAAAPTPMARGDYGARVGTTKVYCHEIESIRQLPDRLLKHPKVKEQLDKLIAAEIKSAKGQIEIKGVRIWEDSRATVR